jgi:TM2 domain-containing membrane protein YozV
MPSPQYDASTPAEPYLPPVKLDLVAAVLSYLIPGLGQVYQGRIGKGLLFFFGLYTLFFYGMWMGQWRNVWLPDADTLPNIVIGPQQLEGPLKSFAYRPQFLGQFCIGIAAWPAIYQYINYDAQKDDGPIFGNFQRTPPEDGKPEKGILGLNDLQRNGSKRWDLGWAYTVIAGVLNLLVIYDAFAGPMFRDPPVSAEQISVEKTQSGTVTPSPSTPAAGPASPAGIAAQGFTSSSRNTNPQRGNS